MSGQSNRDGWYRTDVETFIHVNKEQLREFDLSGELLSIASWSDDFIEDTLRTCEYLGSFSPVTTKCFGRKL